MAFLMESSEYHSSPQYMATSTTNNSLSMTEVRVETQCSNFEVLNEAEAIEELLAF